MSLLLRLALNGITPGQALVKLFVVRSGSSVDNSKFESTLGHSRLLLVQYLSETFPPKYGYPERRRNRSFADLGSRINIRPDKGNVIGKRKKNTPLYVVPSLFSLATRYN